MGGLRALFGVRLRHVAVHLGEHGIGQNIGHQRLADRVGELIAVERANINTLIAEEADLAARLDRTRQQRAIAEARVDAMLLTARLFDMPDPARPNGAVPTFRDVNAEPQVVAS